jgi:uncharacterized membrane protein
VSRPSDPSRDPALVRMELFLGRLLRAGVVTSMILVFAGLALMFLHHRSYLHSADELKRLTDPGAAFPKSLAEVADGLHDRHGQSVVALGLLVLILTPILRVAVSIGLFALERDRAFVVITTAVLTILLASFFLGKVG